MKCLNSRIIDRDWNLITYLYVEFRYYFIRTTILNNNRAQLLLYYLLHQVCFSLNRPYRTTPSKIIAMDLGIVLVITKTDSHYEFKTTN